MPLSPPICQLLQDSLEVLGVNAGEEVEAYKVVARTRAELADLPVLCPVVQLAQLTPSDQLVLFKAQLPLPTPPTQLVRPKPGRRPLPGQSLCPPITGMATKLPSPWLSAGQL